MRRFREDYAPVRDDRSFNEKYGSGEVFEESELNDAIPTNVRRMFENICDRRIARLLEGARKRPTPSSDLKSKIEFIVRDLKRCGEIDAYEKDDLLGFASEWDGYTGNDPNTSQAEVDGAIEDCLGIWGFDSEASINEYLKEAVRDQRQNRVREATFEHDWFYEDDLEKITKKDITQHVRGKFYYTLEQAAARKDIDDDDFDYIRDLFDDGNYAEAFSLLGYPLSYFKKKLPDISFE